MFLFYMLLFSGGRKKKGISKLFQILVFSLSIEYTLIGLVWSHYEQIIKENLMKFEEIAVVITVGYSENAILALH